MDMPDHIILEILLRLPVRSLARFKVVCKSWRSHILNPKFVKKHVLNNLNNDDFVIAHGRYCNGLNQLSLLDVNLHDRDISLNIPMPDKDSFYVVGSCNGLICLAYNFNNGSQRLPRKQCIWNPATGKVKEINRCTIKIKAKSNNDIRVSLGFGFDHASSDYKVVRIVTYKCPFEYDFKNRVEVYSLNKDSWMEVDEEFEFGKIMSIYPAFVNGSIYWISETNSFDEKFAVVSFNLQSENLCKTLVPENVLSSYYNVCDDIFALNESVAVAITDEDKKNGIDIWTLDGDNSWNKKLTINRSVITSIVGCLKTGEFVGLDSNNELVLYNSGKKVVKPTHQLIRRETIRTYNHSESLVSWN
ncbi:F-box domain-containing protein [Heracleum sosnowskyi]|uniref:F-box domain-containing protein n=1 Tax=Heracleum sosnowskyi TaxID=360622 RepID=A0AAD8GRS8_9APIA|nr:F-box domain-containing protein [Heracleum sosnowskyi]